MEDSPYLSRLSSMKKKPHLSLPLRDRVLNACPPMYSPVTDLAYNLGDLNTYDGATPKRRLSLSSVGSPTPPPLPAMQLFKQRTTSIDAGCCLDSPSPIDSPLAEERFEKFLDKGFKEAKARSSTSKHGSAFRRYASLPVTDDMCSPSFKVFSQTRTASTSSDGLSPNKDINSPDKENDIAFGRRVSFELGSPEKHESNSQDSGIGNDRDKDDDDLFVKPVDAPLLRRNRQISFDEDTCSPKKYSPIKEERPVSAPAGSLSFSSSPPPVNSMLKQKQNNSPDLMTSSLTSSMDEDEEDAGFLDFLDTSGNEHQSNMPSFMDGLLKGQIAASASSINETEVQEQVRKVVRGVPRGLFGTGAARLNRSQSFDVRSKPFKRPDPPRENNTPISNKRRKSVMVAEDDDIIQEENIPRPRLNRSHSEAIIKTALSKSDDEKDLIGDFSKPCCLPLCPSSKPDLKGINSETLARLLNNEFSHIVEKYMIIDCRYPYEYEGGHIRGAKNLYRKEDIIEEFLNTPMKVKDSSKRQIIIFHCEFSSERGPKLCRFLRNKDRDSNKECYPELHYPELYLLEGGYKVFFEKHKDLCDPQTYKPMLHKDHAYDLKHFRAKSKSWAGEKNRLAFRPGLKF